MVKGQLVVWILLDSALVIGRPPVVHLSASVCAHIGVSPFDNTSWNCEWHFWYD